MTTLGGLPAHVLLVHATVVLVPLTSLLLVVVAVWPAARRRWAVTTAALAVLTAVLVPVTTESGEWLEHRVTPTALLRAHTELGDTMLPWAIALAVLALAVLARHRRATRAGRRPAGRGPGTAQSAAVPAAARGGRALSLVLAVVAVVVAVGSIGTVYRIGESGARAVWTGQFSEQAQRPPAAPDAAQPTAG